MRVETIGGISPARAACALKFNGGHFCGSNTGLFQEKVGSTCPSFGLIASRLQRRSSVLRQLFRKPPQTSHPRTTYFIPTGAKTQNKSDKMHQCAPFPLPRY
jgi:hypothetical protein